MNLVRRTLARLFFATCPSETHDGIRLIDGSDAPEQAFPRIREALGIVQRYDPACYARVTRDLDRIVVLNFSGPEFWPGLYACVLRRDLLDADTPLGLALAIVHEATHARLWRHGNRYTPPERDHVERICVRAEVAFLRRVPGSESLQQQLRARLETDPWWTHAALVERRLSEAARIGIPRRIAAFLMRLNGWRVPRERP